MADPNVSELATLAIEYRSREIRDNMSKNIALLNRLKKKGNYRPCDGGTQINEEMSYAQNPNGGFYSGGDILPINQASTLTSAVFNIKQYAVAIVLTGLEKAQVRGREKMISVLEARERVAESTMLNDVAQGCYSDGTGSGGKTITGLEAGPNATAGSGTYGGIDRALWPFWRQSVVTGITSVNIQAKYNTLWANLVRNNDRPDLIVADNTHWGFYMGSLQPNQRFLDPEVADLGFKTIKFMDADYLLDGGIGGFCPSARTYFLNTNFLFWRPMEGFDMVPLSPDKRSPVNQDIDVALLGFYGNLTCAGLQFQGTGTA